MSIKIRQRIERTIAERTVEVLLDAGYLLSVNDGEEETLSNSQSPKAILSAMFTTGEDWLIVRKPAGGDSGNVNKGWVRFIYGNDGPDVINDYTTNLEDVLKPVNKLCDDIESGNFKVHAG